VLPPPFWGGKKNTGLVLVVWDHTNIPFIAKNLGVKGTLKWAKEDFDSIWIIDFTKDDLTPVLTKEQENIHPGGACK